VEDHAWQTPFELGLPFELHEFDHRPQPSYAQWFGAAKSDAAQLIEPRLFESLRVEVLVPTYQYTLISNRSFSHDLVR
jgi:hypothetical protein